MRRPSLEELQRQLEEDGGCEAIDGCFVEPDGTCEHGQPSWLLALGLISPHEPPANPTPKQRPHRHQHQGARHAQPEPLAHRHGRRHLGRLLHGLSSRPVSRPQAHRNQVFNGHRCEPVLPLGRRPRPAWLALHPWRPPRVRDRSPSTSTPTSSQGAAL
jgi:hypothetical protein